jgi:hypothetical protein
MKTIIISDVHNRVYWIENALSELQYDNVVFLGDYFDNYGDTPVDAYLSAQWLKQSIYKPNRIHLIGTHDIWYMYPFNKYIGASGNTDKKYYAIKSVLNTDDWKILKLYYYEQNYLMTHAGISSYIIKDYIFRNKDVFNSYIVGGNLRIDEKDIIDKIVKPATQEALDWVSRGFKHPWLEAGFIRGGSQIVGGIIWQDWSEFEPISGLNQIVGHTEHDRPQEKITINSINYVLDTRNRHIGILENGIFEWIRNIYI